MVNQKILTIIEEINIANKKYHDLGNRCFGTPEKVLAFETVNKINDQALNLAESREDLEALKEVVMFGTNAQREIKKRLSALNQ